MLPSSRKRIQIMTDRWTHDIRKRPSMARAMVLMILFVIIMIMFIVGLSATGDRQQVDEMSERGFHVEGLEDGVSLVTHCSVDRLHMLEMMGRYWQGPIVVAVYLRNLDSDLSAFQSHRESLDVELRDRISFVILHFSDDMWSYPVNMLRNRVIQACRTKLMLMVDVDFVPSESLYLWITEQDTTLYTTMNKEKSVYVIPIFQHTGNENNLPHTKEQLIENWDMGITVPNYKGEHHGGHRASNYPKWRSESGLYSINYELRFEPYFLAATNLMPLYDERFLYYGLDKVVHAMGLYRDGFSFVGVADHFLIHFDHDEAQWSVEQGHDRQLWRVLETVEAKHSTIMSWKYWFRDRVSCGIFGVACP